MSRLCVALRIFPCSETGGSNILQVSDKSARIDSIPGLQWTISETQEIRYDFDYLFKSNGSPTQDQEEVFEALGDKAVRDCLEGFNCSLFAYGMTGTGKTYTIFGHKDLPGLVPRCCSTLLDKIFAQQQCEVFPEISFFEIYNEKIKDLLGMDSSGGRKSLRIREHPTNGPYVENLTKHPLSNVEALHKLIEQGVAARTTTETDGNTQSSRSHSIFTIYISQTVQVSNEVRSIQTKLHFIDLAGSERISPETTDSRVSETKSINKSLCTLSIVIRRLADFSKEDPKSSSVSSFGSTASLSKLSSSTSSPIRPPYIPYRDSKLTWLLRDSLGGNAKTTVIITVSPSATCYRETLNALRFSQQLKMIKNRPVITQITAGDNMEQLLAEIARLKRELHECRSRQDERSGDRNDSVGPQPSSFRSVRLISEPSSNHRLRSLSETRAISWQKVAQHSPSDTFVGGGQRTIESDCQTHQAGADTRKSAEINPIPSVLTCKRRLQVAPGGTFEFPDEKCCSLRAVQIDQPPDIIRPMFPCSPWKSLPNSPLQHNRPENLSSPPHSKSALDLIGGLDVTPTQNAPVLSIRLSNDSLENLLFSAVTEEDDFLSERVNYTTQLVSIETKEPSIKAEVNCLDKNLATGDSVEQQLAGGGYMPKKTFVACPLHAGICKQAHDGESIHLEMLKTPENRNDYRLCQSRLATSPVSQTSVDHCHYAKTKYASEAENVALTRGQTAESMEENKALQKAISKQSNAEKPWGMHGFITTTWQNELECCHVKDSENTLASTVRAGLSHVRSLKSHPRYRTCSVDKESKTTSDFLAQSSRVAKSCDFDSNKTKPFQTLYPQHLKSRSKSSGDIIYTYLNKISASKFTGPMRHSPEKNEISSVHHVLAGDESSIKNGGDDKKMNASENLKPIPRNELCGEYLETPISPQIVDVRGEQMSSTTGNNERDLRCFSCGPTTSPDIENTENSPYTHTVVDAKDEHSFLPRNTISKDKAKPDSAQLIGGLLPEYIPNSANTLTDLCSKPVMEDDARALRNARVTVSSNDQVCLQDHQLNYSVQNPPNIPVNQPALPSKGSVYPFVCRGDDGCKSKSRQNIPSQNASNDKEEFINSFKRTRLKSINIEKMKTEQYLNDFITIAHDASSVDLACVELNETGMSLPSTSASPISSEAASFKQCLAQRENILNKVSPGKVDAHAVSANKHRDADNVYNEKAGCCAVRLPFNGLELRPARNDNSLRTLKNEPANHYVSGADSPLTHIVSWKTYHRMINRYHIKEKAVPSHGDEIFKHPVQLKRTENVTPLLHVDFKASLSLERPMLNSAKKTPDLTHQRVKKTCPTSQVYQICRDTFPHKTCERLFSSCRTGLTRKNKQFSNLCEVNKIHFHQSDQQPRPRETASHLAEPRLQDGSRSGLSTKWRTSSNPCSSIGNLKTYNTNNNVSDYLNHADVMRKPITITRTHDKLQHRASIENLASPSITDFEPFLTTIPGPRFMASRPIWKSSAPCLTPHRHQRYRFLSKRKSNIHNTSALGGQTIFVSKTMTSTGVRRWREGGRVEELPDPSHLTIHSPISTASMHSVNRYLKYPPINFKPFPFLQRRDHLPFLKSSDWKSTNDERDAKRIQFTHAEQKSLLANQFNSALDLLNDGAIKNRVFTSRTQRSNEDLRLSLTALSQPDSDELYHVCPAEENDCLTSMTSISSIASSSTARGGINSMGRRDQYLDETASELSSDNGDAFPDDNEVREIQTLHDLNTTGNQQKMVLDELAAKSKRPWRTQNHTISTDAGGLESYNPLNQRAPSCSESDSYGNNGSTSGFIIKNRQSLVTTSSEGLARSSIVFVDMPDDAAPGHSAISQLLIHVSENLATVPSAPFVEDNAIVELKLSPKSIPNLLSELGQLSPGEKRRNLPTLTKILSRQDMQTPLQTNIHELRNIEGELFSYLVSQNEQDLDPLINLRNCLVSHRLNATSNRLLQLHLKSLIRHPSIQENTSVKGRTHYLLGRLEATPLGLSLSQDDADLLLELITMAHVPLFSPTSSPPALFCGRDSPLITAAMRIAEMARKLQLVSDGGEIGTFEHKACLAECRELLAAASNTSCPSACFYSNVISVEDRVKLDSLLAELQTASSAAGTVAIPQDKSTELSGISTRLGEVALQCARLKVAKAHHTVKNRFRLEPKTFQRVCVLEPNDHKLIMDALTLIEAAKLTTDPIISPLKEFLNGSEKVEINEAYADSLKHILMCGLDFQSSCESPVQSIHEALVSNPVKEEVLEQVKGSVLQNPFALAKTPEPEETPSIAIIDAFFQRKESEEDVYENDSLIKTADATLMMSVACSSSDKFNSSRSNLVSNLGTLPPKDSNPCFMLLPETMFFRNLLMSMRRGTGQIFACKLAPFQIIQLCDCVRKLSSLDPCPDDAKLVKKLSTEANRCLKVKLKVKTMNRLRSFYSRIRTPILQNSRCKLENIIHEMRSAPIEGDPVSSSIRLNSESMFYLTEICFSALFKATDALSLVFLGEVREAAASGAASLCVSRTEFDKLMRLYQQAAEQLDLYARPSAGSERSSNNASRLLNLYKLRTLIQSSESGCCEGLAKRLLWKQGLSKIFDHYPEKTTKRPFSDVAFNVFIAETDNIPEDLREDLVSELEILIRACEQTTNLTPEAVNNLISPRIKRNKVIDALCSKFFASAMNGRQLNCDASIVGNWLHLLSRNPDDDIANELPKEDLEELKRFLLTSPKTQELIEAKLTDEVLQTTADGRLASFQPDKLAQIISDLSGPAQTSPRQRLVFCLLLETFKFQSSYPIVLVDQGVLSEFQVKPMAVNECVTETDIDAVEQTPELLEAVDEVRQLQDAKLYLHDLILNEKELVSPEQFLVASKILRNLENEPTNTYQDDGGCLDQLERLKIDHAQFKMTVKAFLASDNSLLYAIASIRGLRARLSKHRGGVGDHTELIFALTVCRKYLQPGSPVYSATAAHEAHLRKSLAEDGQLEMNRKVIEQLQVILEQKLTTDLSIILSQIFQRLGDAECVGDIELLSTLQFICIASVLMPVNVEMNLLAILLCKPIGSLQKETLPVIRAILAEMSNNLRLPSNTTEEQIRLLTPFLPLTIDTQDDRHGIEFDKLLTTICVANGLAEGMDGTTSAKLNQLLAQTFWTVFFNRDRLTSCGLFGRLYKETANYASTWLASDSTHGKEGKFDSLDTFFHDFFYVAPRVPLDQTAHLSDLALKKTSSEVKRLFGSLELDYFQSESYFPLLQSLLITEIFLMHTSSHVLLSHDQLISLYHALSVCLHSGYFDGHLEGKVGLISILNKIEGSLQQQESLTALNRLFLDSSEISHFAKANFPDVKKSIINDLRSHIAPVILPIGGETGDPFTTPDMVLVREGLEAILSGIFCTPPSEANIAIHLMNTVDAAPPSAAELAEIWRILNILFTEEGGRFIHENGQRSTNMSQMRSQIGLSLQAEVAMANINECSAKGSLQSSADVSVFLKSVYALSSAIRSKIYWPDGEVESSRTETFVSSPTESFSSFTVSDPMKTTNGTGEYQSCSSATSVTPQFHGAKDHTLTAPKKADLKSLQSADVPTLLEAYHLSRLILQSGRAIEPFMQALVQIIKPLETIFGNNTELPLSQSQANTLFEISEECANVLRVKLPKESASLTSVQGYLSLALPTSTSPPVAAQNFVTLRVADIRGVLGQAGYNEYTNVNMSDEASTSLNATEILALQGAQKALGGFALNFAEKVSLIYVFSESGDSLLFADLAAAIYKDKIWPTGLSEKQCDFLKKQAEIWRGRLGDMNNLIEKLSTNSGEPTTKQLFEYTQNQSSNSDLMTQLKTDINDISDNLTEYIRTIQTFLTTKKLDPFVCLSVQEAVKLADAVHLISEKTEWLAMYPKVASEAQQKLYLAAACQLACENTSELIELPTAYLSAHEILSSIPAMSAYLTRTDVSFTRLKRSNSAHYMTDPMNRKIKTGKLIYGKQLLRNYRQLNSDSSTLSTTPSSSGSYRSSLDRLHELIEIRRAVVAGSARELRHLGCEAEQKGPKLPNFQRPTYPDKLDLSLLKRRCEEHTQALVERAQYEKEQAALC